MQLILKTSPAQEPLTLEEVKSYLSIPSEHEDRFVRTLISAARSYVEGMIGRSLLRQQWQMHITPPYPRRSPLVKGEQSNLVIELPRPPVLEVSSVLALGKEVPFTAFENRVSLSPSLREQNLTLTYWAGYGETASSLPPDLKLGVLMATRFFYDHQKVHLPFLRPFKISHVV